MVKEKPNSPKVFAQNKHTFFTSTAPDTPNSPDPHCVQSINIEIQEQSGLDECMVGCFKTLARIFRKAAK